MDNIRRILFSILQKFAGRKIFRRVIHVSLMAATLILAGCSSKPIPLATATATHEATATSTATLEPTPMIAPKPDYVTDENSVETDDEIVFVKDDKAMIYNPKTGEIREIKNISTEVTFTNMADASKIVLAIYADEFSSQEKIKKDMSPGPLATNANWQKQFNQDSIGGSGNMDTGTVITFYGVPVEFVKVKNPTGSDTHPVIGAGMLKVPGDLRPVPDVFGVFDNTEKFSLLSDVIVTTLLDDFPNNRQENWLGSTSPTWEKLQSMLKDHAVSCDPVFTRNPATTAKYEPLLGYIPETPDSVKAEKEALMNIMFIQSGVSFDLSMDETKNPTQIGELITELENEMIARGYSNFFFMDSDFNFKIIPLN